MFYKRGKWEVQFLRGGESGAFPAGWGVIYTWQDCSLPINHPLKAAVCPEQELSFPARMSLPANQIKEPGKQSQPAKSLKEPSQESLPTNLLQEHSQESRILCPDPDIVSAPLHSGWLLGLS